MDIDVEKTLERFYKKVTIPKDKNLDDCWKWNGPYDEKGHGMFNIGKRTSHAHRMLYELIHGTIEKGLVIRHKCDNPQCVNLNHLEKGTQADNIRDRNIRNRTAKGSKHGMSILNEQDIENMIEDILNYEFYSVKSCAEYYDISSTTVYDILIGKTWKHITSKYSNILPELRNILNPKPSEELINDTIELYLLGHSERKIAEMLDTTRGTIRSILKRMKI